MARQLGHTSPLGAFRNLGSGVQRHSLGTSSLAILDLKTFYPHGFPVNTSDGTDHASQSSITDNTVARSVDTPAPSAHHAKSRVKGENTPSSVEQTPSFRNSLQRYFSPEVAGRSDAIAPTSSYLSPHQPAAQASPTHASTPNFQAAHKITDGDPSDTREVSATIEAQTIQRLMAENTRNTTSNHPQVSPANSPQSVESVAEPHPPTSAQQPPIGLASTDINQSVQSLREPSPIQRSTNQDNPKIGPSTNIKTQAGLGLKPQESLDLSLNAESGSTLGSNTVDSSTTIPKASKETAPSSLQRAADTVNNNKQNAVAQPPPMGLGSTDIHQSIQSLRELSSPIQRATQHHPTTGQSADVATQSRVEYTKPTTSNPSPTIEIGPTLGTRATDSPVQRFDESQQPPGHLSSSGETSIAHDDIQLASNQQPTAPNGLSALLETQEIALDQAKASSHSNSDSPDISQRKVDLLSKQTINAGDNSSQAELTHVETLDLKSDNSNQSFDCTATPETLSSTIDPIQRAIAGSDIGDQGIQSPAQRPTPVSQDFAISEPSATDQIAAHSEIQRSPNFSDIDNSSNHQLSGSQESLSHASAADSTDALSTEKSVTDAPKLIQRVAEPSQTIEGSHDSSQVDTGQPSAQLSASNLSETLFNHPHPTLSTPKDISRKKATHYSGPVRLSGSAKISAGASHRSHSPNSEGFESYPSENLGDPIMPSRDNSTTSIKGENSSQCSLFEKIPNQVDPIQRVAKTPQSSGSDSVLSEISQTDSPQLSANRRSETETLQNSGNDQSGDNLESPVQRSADLVQSTGESNKSAQVDTDQSIAFDQTDATQLSANNLAETETSQNLGHSQSVANSEESVQRRVDLSGSPKVSNEPEPVETTQVVGDAIAHKSNNHSNTLPTANIHSTLQRATDIAESPQTIEPDKSPSVQQLHSELTTTDITYSQADTLISRASNQPTVSQQPPSNNPSEASLPDVSISSQSLSHQTESIQRVTESKSPFNSVSDKLGSANAAQPLPNDPQTNEFSSDIQSISNSVKSSQRAAESIELTPLVSHESHQINPTQLSDTKGASASFTPEVPFKDSSIQCFSEASNTESQSFDSNEILPQRDFSTENKIQSKDESQPSISMQQAVNPSKITSAPSTDSNQQENLQSSAAPDGIQAANQSAFVANQLTSSPEIQTALDQTEISPQANLSPTASAPIQRQPSDLSGTPDNIEDSPSIHPQIELSLSNQQDPTLSNQQDPTFNSPALDLGTPAIPPESMGSVQRSTIEPIQSKNVADQISPQDRTAVSQASVTPDLPTIAQNTSHSQVQRSLSSSDVGNNSIAVQLPLSQLSSQQSAETEFNHKSDTQDTSTSAEPVQHTTVEPTVATSIEADRVSPDNFPDIQVNESSNVQHVASSAGSIQCADEPRQTITSAPIPTDIAHPHHAPEVKTTIQKSSTGQSVVGLTSGPTSDPTSGPTEMVQRATNLNQATASGSHQSNQTDVAIPDSLKAAQDIPESSDERPISSAPTSIQRTISPQLTSSVSPELTQSSDDCSKETQVNVLKDLQAATSSLEVPVQRVYESVHLASPGSIETDISCPQKAEQIIQEVSDVHSISDSINPIQCTNEVTQTTTSISPDEITQSSNKLSGEAQTQNLKDVQSISHSATSVQRATESSQPTALDVYKPSQENIAPPDRSSIDQIIQEQNHEQAISGPTESIQRVPDSTQPSESIPYGLSQSFDDSSEENQVSKLNNVQPIATSAISIQHVTEASQTTSTLNSTDTDHPDRLTESQTIQKSSHGQSDVTSTGSVQRTTDLTQPTASDPDVLNQTDAASLKGWSETQINELHDAALGSDATPSVQRVPKPGQLTDSSPSRTRSVNNVTNIQEPTTRHSDSANSPTPDSPIQRQVANFNRSEVSKSATLPLNQTPLENSQRSNHPNGSNLSAISGQPPVLQPSQENRKHGLANNTLSESKQTPIEPTTVQRDVISDSVAEQITQFGTSNNSSMQLGDTQIQSPESGRGEFASLKSTGQRSSNIAFDSPKLQRSSETKDKSATSISTSITSTHKDVLTPSRQKQSLAVLRSLSVLEPLPSLHGKTSQTSLKGNSTASELPSSSSTIQRQTINDIPGEWSNLESLVADLTNSHPQNSPAFDQPTNTDSESTTQPSKTNSDTIQRQVSNVNNGSSQQQHAITNIPGNGSNLENLVTPVQRKLSGHQSTKKASSQQSSPTARKSTSKPSQITSASPTVKLAKPATVTVQHQVASPVSSTKPTVIQASPDNSSTVTVSADAQTDDSHNYSKYLEMLVQEVYSLLRQRLSLEQERRGPKYPR
ncbi:hypothetical protein D0962_32660 [Leptolyngbyaceae cyanobacterium CCMR0082]|uniref:Uncharacterized protein n=1 Tax=Adonisia turfae CCMR0082 TaxID=2304604 RepID=A0A6M0SFY1_9CYAN|nr:hypothetical protein [Adonisia turfae]NEZ67457.1 hypothetical protein [Adonisia turfae CCMR0082]